LHYMPLPRHHWSHHLKGALPWRVTSRISRFLPKAGKRRIHVRNRDLIGSEALIDDFIEAITTGRAPAVSGVEGLEDLRIVLAAYQAADTGVPIALEQALRTSR
jgi:predicted dehydrogenase